MYRNGSVLLIRSLTISLLLVTSSLFSAENEPLWKAVDGWNIRIDTSLNNSCFLYQIYEGNSVIRIGFTTPQPSVYIMVGNPDWKSLEEGKEYPIKIRFGNEAPWSGDANALLFGKMPVLMLNVTSTESVAVFLREFMRETSVRVEYKSKSISHLSLKGSFKAGMALMDCQKKVNEVQDSADPFQSPESSSPDDPFAT